MGKRYAPRMLAPLALLALTAPLPASAQTSQLTGRVRSDDGRPVEGALAELHPASDSTRTLYTLANDLGFFSFRDLEPDTYVLTLTRLGFAEHREPVSVGAGSTDVAVVMATEAIVLGGVTVEAERSRAKTRFEESAGITVQEIEAAALKAMPVIAESDPLRGHRGAPRGHDRVGLLGGRQRPGRIRGPEPDPSRRGADLQSVPPRRNLLRLQRGHGGPGRAAVGRLRGRVRRPGRLGPDRDERSRRRQFRGRRGRQHSGDPRGGQRSAPPRRHRDAGVPGDTLARVRSTLLCGRALQALGRLPVPPVGPSGDLRGVDGGRKPASVRRLQRAGRRGPDGTRGHAASHPNGGGATTPSAGRGRSRWAGAPRWRSAPRCRASSRT